MNVPFDLSRYNKSKKYQKRRQMKKQLMLPFEVLYHVVTTRRPKGLALSWSEQSCFPEAIDTT